MYSFSVAPVFSSVQVLLLYLPVFATSTLAQYTLPPETGFYRRNLNSFTVCFGCGAGDPCLNVPVFATATLKHAAEADEAEAALTPTTQSTSASQLASLLRLITLIPFD